MNITARIVSVVGILFLVGMLIGVTNRYYEKSREPNLKLIPVGNGINGGTLALDSEGNVKEYFMEFTDAPFDKYREDYINGNTTD